VEEPEIDIEYYISGYKMDQSTAIAIAGIVISVGGSLLAVVNHKRIRSKCCDKKLEVSLDVESTTPPKVEEKQVVV
jgi:hypothetical protein